MLRIIEAISRQLLGMFFVVSLSQAAPEVQKNFYEGGEYVVVQDNLEIKIRTFVGSELKAIARMEVCDYDGRLLYTRIGVPAQRNISLVNDKQLWFELSLLNKNEHSIQLGQVDSRLITPLDEVVMPYTQKQLVRQARSQTRCIAPFVRREDKVDFLKPGLKLLPGITSMAWLGFSAGDVVKGGHWRLSLFDLPVKTSADGNVSVKAKVILDITISNNLISVKLADYL